MQYSKGFAWLLHPGIGLCELGVRSSTALVQYHVSMANTPTEWMGLHAFWWQTGMPVPEGWPVGPFPRPLSPRNVQLMLLPCIVSNRRKPLSTDLPCFPLGPPSPKAAIARSPYWLGIEGRMWGGWRRTSATLIASGVLGAMSQFFFHPSAGEVTARSWSFCHHNSIDCASRPLDICPDLCLLLLPQLPPKRFLLFGRPCPWLLSFSRSHLEVAQRWPHLDWGWLVKLGWCPRQTAYLQTPENFCGQVPSYLVIRLGAHKFRCGPRWQESIVDWPYQALQCFAVWLTPGNAFQHLSTAWQGAARGWRGAAASDASAPLYPELVLRFHH